MLPDHNSSTPHVNLTHRTLPSAFNVASSINRKHIVLALAVVAAPFMLPRLRSLFTPATAHAHAVMGPLAPTVPLAITAQANLPKTAAHETATFANG